MNTLLNSFLRIFRKGSNSILKIVIMSVGLAVGITLISIVHFQRSFDSYVPDMDRVYRVIPVYEKDGQVADYENTSGAIAPGIKEYSPAVSTATRYTLILSDEIFEDVETERFTGKINSCKCRKGIIADSCFFDIFNRKIIAGDEIETMQSPEKVLISKTFAENMFGIHDNFECLIGQIIREKNNKEKQVVIGCIYEDFPANSSLDETDIIIPMTGISRFTYDGSKNWVGNDRYQSFVKLHEDTDDKEIVDAINKMCEEKLPNELLEKSGLKISYYIKPLKSYNYDREGVKDSCLVISIVAAIVLATAIFNYILISISALVKRSKTVAVRKCYGAEKRNIYAILFSDAFVEILISLGFATMLIFSFDTKIEQFAGMKVNDLFASGGWVVMGIVAATVIFICGYFPSVTYWRTPVSNVFRGFKEMNRRWKQTLLFLQFVMSDAIIVISIVILIQYNHAVNSDPGYEFENVVFVSGSTVSTNKIDVLNNIKDEIEKLPFVENQLFSYSIPMSIASGNNILLPNSDVELFNAADLYAVYGNYLNFFKIPLIEGKYFDEINYSENHHEVLVSRSFKEKLQLMTDWDDVVGREICVSEHADYKGKPNIYTICGVYDDFLIGLTIGSDDRPSMMFYGLTECWLGIYNYHFMKFNKVNSKNINAIENIYKTMLPDKDVEILSYSDYYRDAYKEARYIRDMILFSLAVILIITVVGLIGYINDEMRRRSAEVALRKINGAVMTDVLRLFIADVMKFATAAVVVGSVIAYFIKDLILNMFPDQATFGIWIYLIGIVTTLCIAAAVVVLSVRKIANANPVDSLKKE